MTKKLHIGFCMPQMIIGGAESVFIRTLDELKKDTNIRISVFLHDQLKEPFFIEYFQKSPQIYLYTVYRLGGIFQWVAKYTKFFPLKNIRKIIYSLYKKYRRFLLKHNKVFKSVDVFVDYKNLSFVRELKDVQKPKIGWVHGSINHFRTNNLIHHFDVFDKVICLSDSFAQDFKQEYPRYSDKILRIYNPIDFDNIRLLSTQGESFQGKYFCVVSRLDKDKDIMTVLNAFDMFYQKENKPAVNLVVVGTGCNATLYQQYASKLSAVKNIIFTGTKTNPFGYMAGAVAHILSSYNEGLPTVLIEAQTLGVLNISSDCKSGPREILLNGNAGLLFEPGNAEQLSKLMSQVWNNEVDKEAMINNATTALDRFGGDIIAEAIKNIINTVIIRKG